jgi:hypothetical protein
VPAGGPSTAADQHGRRDGDGDSAPVKFLCTTAEPTADDGSRISLRLPKRGADRAYSVQRCKDTVKEVRSEGATFTLLPEF